MTMFKGPETILRNALRGFCEWRVCVDDKGEKICVKQTDVEAIDTLNKTISEIQTGVYKEQVCNFSLIVMF